MITGLDAIFGSEVWKGKHPALILGWGDDQLAPIAKVLDPFLPSDLTSERKLAVAACARSLVAESYLSGRPVRYSKAMNHYQRPMRYRQGDRFYSWYFVTNSMDHLERLGLISSAPGVWFPGGGGRQSVSWPTAKLLELLTPLIDTGEPRGDLPRSEVIVLRDRHDKKEIDYDDTDETIALRAEVETLNDALRQLHLYRLGEAFTIPLMRRVFNGTVERGGRCYCHGTSFQNIRSGDRLDLQFLIDGVLHPVVEIDYANLHAVMAYSDAGLPIPPGDQYATPGFSRLVAKRAFNVLLNATARHKAVAALSEDLHAKDDELWQHSKLTTHLRAETYPFAKAVIAAIEEKHQPIAEYFGSDCGAAFMRRDSDMAVRVMLRMIERTGRCPMPIHDSFLVPDIDGEALASVMQEVASEEGLPLCLKLSTRSPLMPSLGRPNISIWS